MVTPWKFHHGYPNFGWFVLGRLFWVPVSVLDFRGVSGGEAYSRNPLYTREFYIDANMPGRVNCKLILLDLLKVVGKSKHIFPKW